MRKIFVENFNIEHLNMSIPFLLEAWSCQAWIEEPQRIELVFSSHMHERIDALEKECDRYKIALDKVIQTYPHSSGCGKGLGFPFSQDEVDGCDCGTNSIEQVAIARNALAPQAKEPK